jgi:hypothetical protein
MTDPGNIQNNGSQTPPPPPPPPAPVTPEAAPKKKRTRNILLGVGAAILLIIIISSVAGGGKSKTDSASPATTKVGEAKVGDSASTTAAPASATTCKETPNTESFDSKKQGLYPDRAGVTKTDHEAAVGDCVRISGATTYVTAFKVVDSPGYNDGQLIVITMSETNRDPKPKSYTLYDWSLQTPKGILNNPDGSWGVYDPEGTALSGAEMVTGTTVEGTVGFKYDGPGTYYVIFDGTFQNDRGVWAITVP